MFLKRTIHVLKSTSCLFLIQILSGIFYTGCCFILSLSIEMLFEVSRVYMSYIIMCIFSIISCVVICCVYKSMAKICLVTKNKSNVWISIMLFSVILTFISTLSLVREWRFSQYLVCILQQSTMIDQVFTFIDSDWSYAILFTFENLMKCLAIYSGLKTEIKQIS